MNHDRPEYDGAYGGPYSDPYSDPYGAEPYGGEAYGGEVDPYGADGGAEAYGAAYGARDAYEAAVGALADPLTDPLPGQRDAGPTGGTGGTDGAEGEFEPHTSPWFRPHQQPQAPQAPQAPQTQQAHQAPQQAQQPVQPAQPVQPVEPSRGGMPYEGAAAPTAPTGQRGAPSWAVDERAAVEPPRVEWGRTAGDAPAAGAAAPGVPEVSETAALPTVDVPGTPGAPDRTARTDRPDTSTMPVRRPAGAERPGSRRARAARPAGAERSSGMDGGADDDRRTVGLRRPDEAELGRAARRKAAKGGRGKGGKGGSRGRKAPPPAPPVRAGTRLEARRAARAAKDGPVVILSRFIGEVFITLGVLMLLFVAYQLWWTNVLAHQKADKAADDLADRWKEHPERKPGKFTAGQGFAIMYIPKLDIRVPVAEGVSKKDVLDKGMVGHYDADSGLKTAMPWDKQGNFSVAGHRNTHGEPFRYINKLVAGDEIIVETADTYYTYKMHSRLPSTSPSNTTVVDPVPRQSGFEKPGRYVTLTTCTPEFTSKYRLIVWGKMVEERPRSKGKPDALVG
ncbi:class E sortase [Streptomyces armeniacus]|uniref:Class E sortase n=1 Tax=Streptomyces armeniacus TaxID=83291 RepID=A0A345XPA4_9ACTN|nr:class E sortase [Streptomyces armeniacus]AXK33470.1 class E sortase [Streptomyces armeniacus]